MATIFSKVCRWTPVNLRNCFSGNSLSSSYFPIALPLRKAKENIKNLITQEVHSLDWDQAGKKAYKYWRTYPNLKPWPAANGKSIGDDFIAGVDLLAWVSQGIQIYR